MAGPLGSDQPEFPPSTSGGGRMLDPMDIFKNMGPLAGMLRGGGSTKVTVSQTQNLQSGIAVNPTIAVSSPGVSPSAPVTFSPSASLPSSVTATDTSGIPGLGGLFGSGLSSAPRQVHTLGDVPVEAGGGLFGDPMLLLLIGGAVLLFAMGGK